MTPVTATRKRGVQNTNGAWEKLWASATPDRTGVRVLCTDNAVGCYVATVPTGTGAPAGLDRSYADYIVQPGDTLSLGPEARDTVDVWYTGSDEAGGQTTINAWEVMGS